MKEKTIRLANSRDLPALARSLKAKDGDDLWMVDFGPGDRAEVETFLHQPAAQ